MSSKSTTRRPGKTTPILVLALVISAAFILFEFWQSGSRLYSDPAAVREPERLQALRRQVGPGPSPLSDLALQTLSRTNSNGSILYSLELPHENENPFHGPQSFELTEIDATNRVEIDRGVVFLKSIETELPQPQVIVDSETNAAAKPNPNPKVFDHSEFYVGAFPKVRFQVVHEGIGPIRVLDAQVVDATSGHNLIGNGFSYIEREGSISIWSHLQTWSPRSIYFALDIAQGDAKVTSFRLLDPSSVSFAAEGFQLLDAIDGVVERPFLVTRKTIGGKPHDLRAYIGPTITTNRDHSTGDTVCYNNGIEPVDATPLSDRSHYGLKLKRGQIPQSDSSTWVFFINPSAVQAPLRIEFLDTRGNVIPITSSYAESSFQTFELECAVADVHSIRATRLSTIRRLLFEIPRIPGLPEANLIADNLFDLEIPYIRLRNYSTLSSAVWGSAQISPPFPSLNMFLGNRTPPGRTYPLEFTNTSPRELFSYYEATVGSGSFIVIDRETHSATIQDRFWRRISKRIQGLSPQILPPGSTR